MSDGYEARAELRIVRGEPTPEELAALTAIVTAAGAASEPAAAEAPQPGRWNDPAYAHRRLWLTGPGAWRAGARWG
jgi:acyl-CoA carboxylase epsilon subunit